LSWDHPAFAGESAVGRSINVFIFAAALVLGAQNARADNEPLLWPDGSVSYRDWGLNRPGVPILIERPYAYGYRYGGDGPLITKNESGAYYPRGYRNPDYYPSNFRDPDAYRMKPPVRPVKPEPYSRSWGVGSDNVPASEADPTGPSVIYAPEEGKLDHGKKHGHEHAHPHHSDHKVHR
jgi:hypothetical protein